MTEQQAPYGLGEGPQHDYAPTGHFTCHRDQGDECSPTRPAWLPADTPPSALAVIDAMTPEQQAAGYARLRAVVLDDAYADYPEQHPVGTGMRISDLEARVRALAEVAETEARLWREDSDLKQERIEELTLRLEDSAARLASVAAIAREAGDKAYLYGARAEALEQERDAERAHTARLAALLTELTWEPVGTTLEPELWVCAICNGHEPEHMPNCALAAALAATPEGSAVRWRALEAERDAMQERVGRLNRDAMRTADCLEKAQAVVDVFKRRDPKPEPGSPEEGAVASESIARLVALRDALAALDAPEVGQ